MATTLRDLDRELAGLDRLEAVVPSRPSRAARLWAAAWPKLAAIGISLLAWQVVVWSGWRPEYLLPGPVTVLRALVDDFGDIMQATATTLQRAAFGFAVALVVGVVVGALVSQVPALRAAFGSLITGLQTMPSIAWFPLAILLFRLSEGAITFVVVLGAAPSIANGLIGGIDHVPPLYLRAGRVLGAHGWARLRHVVLPAALPSFVGGLKQGWAFAWRSLLAGELLVIVPGRASLGQRLQFERELSDTAGLLAVMIVILVVGVVVDALVFGVLDRAIRRRYGLLDPATA